MNEILAQKAISAALEGKWDEAVEINKKILKTSPKDVACLNRLSRAYIELGQIKNAKNAAEKVLKIDPFNNIAKRTLEKTRGLKEGETITSGPSFVDSFIEEPGKSKVVSLIHLADPKIASKLDAGDSVQLDYHCHRVQVSTSDGKYIGKLTDDISLRIKRLIAMGNKYQAIIKSSEPREIKILIRETFKGNKAKDIISFPSEKIDYVSFASPSLVQKEGFNLPEEEN